MQPSGPELADRILKRLRYPTRVRQHVVRIVAGHAFQLDGPIDGRVARRFLAEHGDAAGARPDRPQGGRPRREARFPPHELEALAQLRELVAAGAVAAAPDRRPRGHR